VLTEPCFDISVGLSDICFVAGSAEPLIYATSFKFVDKVVVLGFLGYRVGASESNFCVSFLNRLVIFLIFVLW
jgi:hypothetical protein